MTSALKSPRAVADVTRGTILASVEIAAPIERVFRAVSSDEITRWWGSADTYRTTRWTGDVRVGGAWRAEGTGAQGDFSVGGEFLEIDPPRKLVQTWRPSWEPGLLTTMTYLLETIAGGTRVTVRHEGFGDHVDACRAHTGGWENVLGWLTTFLEAAS